MYTVKNSAKYLSEMHDFVLAYARQKINWVPNLVARKSESVDNYNNPDNDPRGKWTTNAIQARNYYSLGQYEITSPNGKVFSPPNGTYWRVSEENFKKLDEDNRIWWGKDGTAIPRIKKFFSEVKQGVVTPTLWTYKEVGTNGSAKQETRDIFSDKEDIFITPKPVDLINRILELSTNSNDLILDSFAGSGTTGHAVLDLNKQDGGNRKFILVEMDDHIAPNVTAERLRRVINGYDKGGDASKPVDGLGGGFRYCRLGVPLFNEFGDIDGGVTFPDLAAHVFFAEFGVPIPSGADGNTPLLGTYRDTAVYLLYAPSEAGFARAAAGNVLTPDMLAALPPVAETPNGTAVRRGAGAGSGSDADEWRPSYEVLPPRRCPSLLRPAPAPPRACPCCALFLSITL